MSRAVQRKRKRLSKKQMSSLESTSSIGKMMHEDSDGDHDQDMPSDNDVAELDETINNNDDYEELISNARDVEKIFDVTQLSVMGIAHLKDGAEVTSNEKALLLLSKLVYPTNTSGFFAKYWERSALHCVHNEEFFKNVISRKTLENIFNKQLLFENENVKFYDPRTAGILADRDDNDEDEGESQDGEEGEAKGREVKNSEIWSAFNAGSTVTLLTPQIYSDNIWKILSTLEHEFQCRVAAQVVLAPPLSSLKPKATNNASDAASKAATAQMVQYDNSNAFIMQLEGRCRWRVAPNPHAELNMTSVAGFIPLADIDEWSKPSVDVVLAPGDCLYIPKGWVFQQDNHGAASATTDGHSLHLKICANPGATGTTGDLLQLVVPEALAEAVQSHVEMRAALPRRFTQHIGIAASENEDDRLRERLQAQIAGLLKIVTQKAMDILDPATDQLKKQFIGARLPVPQSAAEEACTAAGAPLIYPYTQLRMLRPGIATAVVEQGKVVVYHCMDNSRELFGTALNPLEFELDDGPAIEALLTAYPDAVTVSELDHPSEELDDKLSIAQALYKEGFLLIADEVSRPSAGPPKKAKKEHKASEGSAGAKSAGSSDGKKAKLGDGKVKAKKSSARVESDDDDPF